jgi:hypothetical protein
MTNILRRLIEIIFWISLFISPVLFSLLIAFIVVINMNEFNIYWFYSIGAIGIIIGFIFAEYIRRKYGCSNFYSKLLNMPEFTKKNK